MPASTVLIVEHFEMFRRFVCSMLDLSPMFRVVGQAADGFEAVEKAANIQPDIILLSVTMPRLNGIEAAYHISKVAPQSKILLLSEGNDAAMQELQDVGACGWILKEDASDKLLPAMAAILRGEKLPTPRVTSLRVSLD
jgi:DNA-binding NarL/FixJ family response regulator